MLTSAGLYELSLAIGQVMNWTDKKWQMNKADWPKYSLIVMAFSGLIRVSNIFLILTSNRITQDNWIEMNSFEPEGLKHVAA